MTKVMLKTPKIFMLVPLFVVFCLFASSFVTHQKVTALSGADFNAARIIDDGIFFNPNTMTSGDIQSFLNNNVPVCETNHSQNGYSYPPPYICLKDYTTSTNAMSADGYCGALSAMTASAATIIKAVATACSINPQVLLVLLQKEQILVTDTWPLPTQYQKATGYGCPDTPLPVSVDSNQNGCYDDYEGFFKQVYYGARQYQKYAKQPQQYNFRAGQAANIQYNPNTGCGSSVVTIQNQSTAGLYNYTPYQPNQAALNNLYGSAPPCGAYGNRNFWRMYINWFGSTYSNTPFAWSYEDQSAFYDAARNIPFTSTPTVAPGGKLYMRVNARNMGTQTWDQSFMHLGGSRPIDRASVFANIPDGWLSNTRPARLLESSVGPGQIGTFEFTMLAPATVGTYGEYFNLVAEGRAWLNDLGLYFVINVSNTLPPSNSNHKLLSGEMLQQNNFILSPDKQSALTLQKDGNLVLNSNFKLVWSTGALGSNANKLLMQPDGNLVLYTQNNVALWSSQTDGNPGAWLNLQTDGNMVIYSASNTAIWSTSTFHIPDHSAYVNTTLGTGRLYPGQSLDTADRRFHLVLQPDGNLVLYSPTKAVWATGTDGQSVSFLNMQPDGNMVLYDRDTRPIWYSGTGSHHNLRLVIQQDGNLVMYSPANTAFWSTSTAGAQ